MSIKPRAKETLLLLGQPDRTMRRKPTKTPYFVYGANGKPLPDQKPIYVHTKLQLMQAGFIAPLPQQPIGAPTAYVITDKGKAALWDMELSA